MVWDATLPPGSEAISNGDNRIRELKTDIATSLSAYGNFPGADTANPKYIWTILRGNTASRPATPVSGQMYANTQTFSLERYNGATWDDITSLVDASTLAGNGLAGSGSVLSVNVDGATLEINADTLRIKDLGVTLAKHAANSVDETKITTSVAGNGLSGGGGSALAVNVDNSSIEINSDTLRVKAAGITEAMLDPAFVAKLSPKSIQRFSITQTLNRGSDTSATVSANTNQTITAITTAKTVVILNGVRVTAQTNSAPSFVLGSARLTSTTNVNIVVSCDGDSANNTVDIIVDFEVLEYN